MKYFVVIFFVIFFTTCIDTAENHLLDFQKYFANKNADSIVLAAIHKGQVIKNKDSTTAYLTLCKTITDSLLVWNEKYAAERLAIHLVSLESQFTTDSLVMEKFVSIIYSAAISNYEFVYNDTLVSLFETVFYNTKDSIKLINSVNVLSTEYNILGDKKKTEHYYDMGYLLLEHFVKTNTKKSLKAKVNTFVTLINNKTDFYNEFYLYDSTIKYATIGLSLDSVAPQRIAVLKSNLAEALYYTGKKQQVLPLLNESLALLYKEDTTKEDIRNRISGVVNVKALLLHHEKKYLQSIDYLKQSFTKINYQFFSRYTGKTLAAIAGNFLEMGLTDSALHYAHEALRTVIKVDSGNIFSLPSLHKIYTENTIEECADTLSSAYIKKYQETEKNEFAAATLKCLDIAFVAENKLLVNYTSDESKIAVLDASRNRSEKAIAFCYLLFQKTKNKIWARKAFEYAERNKAIVLLQSLKKNIAANVLLQSDSVYKRLQNLQYKAAFLEKKLTTTEQSDQFSARASDSTIIQLSTAKEKIDNDIIQSSTQLLKENPTLKGLLQSRDTLNMQLIEKQVLKTKNEALLEFFSGASSIYTFVVSKGGNILFTKCDSSIIPSIHFYLSFFTKEDSIAAHPKVFQDAAFRLFIQLGLDPVCSAYNKLIIIPDGIFSSVPFESLLYKPASSLSLKSLPYFIKACNISYAFSASTLLKQKEQKINTSHTMLAMAPVFNDLNSAFAALPGTVSELAVIKKQMPTGHYFLNGDASLNNFRKYCTDAEYIHLATHAFANTDGTTAQVNFADSALTLNEIYSTPLHANLAVLSACNTGIGRMQTGEGYMSLARGFYYAGVPQIITSLWQLNDAGTQQIFSVFYALAQKHSLNEAFHQSKLTYLETSQNNANYSPYYWAGFIFIGDDAVPSSLSSFFLYFILITATLFLITIWIFKKVRS